MVYRPQGLRHLCLATICFLFSLAETASGDWTETVKQSLQPSTGTGLPSKISEPSRAARLRSVEGSRSIQKFSCSLEPCPVEPLFPELGRASVRSRVGVLLRLVLDVLFLTKDIAQPGGFRREHVL